MLLVLALYLVAYLLCVAALWFWRVNRRSERPPAAPKLLRGPGESLRWRLQRLDDALLLHAFGAAFLPMTVFCGGLMLALRFDDRARDLTLAGTFALFLITLFFVGRWMMQKITLRRDCHLGLFGEKMVAEALAPLAAEGCRIFHDVPAGAFNLDHVVVGPTGVFAIETKTRRARRGLSGRRPDEIVFDGTELIFPWGNDTFGLDQVRHRAAWLAEWIRVAAGEHVQPAPVLTFPGWLVTTPTPLTAALRFTDIHVLGAAELPSFIRQSPPVLRLPQIDAIARQLEQRCRDVEF